LIWRPSRSCPSFEACCRPRPMVVAEPRVSCWAQSPARTMMWPVQQALYW
jgi:hypothetical protein